MAEEELSLFDRPIPAVIMQGVGLVCLLVAAAVIYDGWHVLGVLGAALVFGRAEDIQEAVVLLRLLARRRRNGDG
jgi:hypothetical protein